MNIMKISMANSPSLTEGAQKVKMHKDPKIRRIKIIPGVNTGERRGARKRQKEGIIIVFWLNWLEYFGVWKRRIILSGSDSVEEQ